MCCARDREWGDIEASVGFTPAGASLQTQLTPLLGAHRSAHSPYPAFAKPCASQRTLPVASATVDGEAVMCDPQGVPDFDALRSALARRQGRSDVFLFAFDLLELDGRDLRQEPWTARRKGLVRLLRWTGDGIRLLSVMATATRVSP